MGQQPVPPPHQLPFYPPQQQPYYQLQPPMGAYGAYPPPQAGFYQYQTGPPPPGYNVIIFFLNWKQIHCTVTISNNVQNNVLNSIKLYVKEAVLCVFVESTEDQFV